MIEKLKLKLLKWKLNRAYNKWLEEQDEYSCGIALAEHISPRLSLLRTRVDTLYDKCIALEERINGK